MGNVSQEMMPPSSQ